MQRERLKDQIESPRVSVFDSFVRALVMLVSLGAVYYALSGRGLPKRAESVAAANDAARASETIILTATQNHTFYWNREGPFALDDFSPRLTTWLKTTSTPQVVITADDSALLADALHLLNVARHQGVTNVRLEAYTRPSR